ncbi:MAG: alanine racemase [Actinomycetota bacterium]|nr:alanine racemase [Actinomycetota bacterium]
MQVPPSGGHRPSLAADRIPVHVQERLRSRPPDSSGYVYDLDAVAARARRLRDALPAGVDVCFAMKANSHPDVLAALVHGGLDGFDVASESELQAVTTLRGRHDRLRVMATGPAKTESFLAALVDQRADVVNVESVLELNRLSAVASERAATVPVALRVNPRELSVGGSLVMGGTATQFGIPEEEVSEVLTLAQELPGVRPVGFHVHAVCQNLDAAAHAAYVGWCVEWSGVLADKHGLDLRLVDVGGGIGVPFDSGEAGFDVERFGAELAGMTLPERTRLVVEPGRWLVTEAGWYAARVVDVKRAYGETFALVRGGINHFQLPISWDIVHNFAVLPVDDWPHGFPRPQAVDTAVRLVGELCTTEDTLARDIRVSRVRAGDLVVFPDAGSYGWEFAMPSFLGHPPAERTVLGGDIGHKAPELRPGQN